MEVIILLYLVVVGMQVMVVCLVRAPYVMDDNRLKGLEETDRSNKRFKQCYLLGKVNVRLLYYLTSYVRHFCSHLFTDKRRSKQLISQPWLCLLS